MAAVRLEKPYRTESATWERAPPVALLGVLAAIKPAPRSAVPFDVPINQMISRTLPATSPSQSRELRLPGGQSLELETRDAYFLGVESGITQQTLRRRVDIFLS